MGSFSVFKTGTFWGAVFAASFSIAKDHTPANIGESVAAVIAVARGRQAIAKNGGEK